LALLKKKKMFQWKNRKRKSSEKTCSVVFIPLWLYIL